MEEQSRNPANRALFVSEIVTISLLGRKDDVERLDRLLDDASAEELQNALIELADAIRSRHDMGLRKDCCKECERFDTCDLKWLKAERRMRPTCCPRCGNFHKCLKSHHETSKDNERRRAADAKAAAAAAAACAPPGESPVATGRSKK